MGAPNCSFLFVCLAAIEASVLWPDTALPASVVQSGRVDLIHDHRTLAPLPQMACPFVSGVDAGGLFAVGPGNHLTKSVLMGGNDDEMDMIGHQAIAPDFTAGVFDGPAKHTQIGLIIIARKENLFPSATAPSHVAGQAGPWAEIEHGMGVSSIVSVLSP